MSTGRLENRIQELGTELNYTPLTLSQQTGLSRATIATCWYKLTRVPTNQTLALISQALEVHPMDLLTWVEETPTHPQAQDIDTES